MDVFEAIQEPRETIERLLEAGRLAPSAGNSEPWHFITVTHVEKRKTLSKGLYAKFITQAPLAIVVCGDKKASADWYAVDASLAVENMVLSAVGEGLGTCIVGSFTEADVKALLKIPERFEVIVIIAVGYPREKLDLGSKLLKLVRSRKVLSDVASEETFGNPFIPQKLDEP
jgi:nitroreductase